MKTAHAQSINYALHPAGSAGEQYLTSKNSYRQKPKAKATVKSSQQATLDSLRELGEKVVMAELPQDVEDRMCLMESQFHVRTLNLMYFR